MKRLQMKSRRCVRGLKVWGRINCMKGTQKYFVGISNVCKADEIRALSFNSAWKSCWFRLGWFEVEDKSLTGTGSSCALCFFFSCASFLFLTLLRCSHRLIYGLLYCYKPWPVWKIHLPEINSPSQNWLCALFQLSSGTHSAVCVKSGDNLPKTLQSATSGAPSSFLGFWWAGTAPWLKCLGVHLT